MNTNIAPDTTAPAGADPDRWEHHNGRDYRILYGVNRTVDGRPDVLVMPSAVQLDGGSIDTGVIEAPGVHVEVGGHPLTVPQARALAEALLDAIAELNTWAGEPARRIDRADFRLRRTPTGWRISQRVGAGWELLSDRYPTKPEALARIDQMVSLVPAIVREEVEAREE